MYVFCKLDPIERMPVLLTPGVLHFVGIGKTPVPVEQSEIAALQKVLSISSIPWKEGQLVQVRHTFCHAVATNEPDYARNAVRKLRQIVEQLALGVGGNAAYQLLINHFK